MEDNTIHYNDGLRINIEKYSYKPKPFNADQFLAKLCGGSPKCLEEFDKTVRAKAKEFNSSIKNE